MNELLTIALPKLPLDANRSGERGNAVLIKEEGIAVPQIAKDYGVHHTTIHGWLGAGGARRAKLVGTR